MSSEETMDRRIKRNLPATWPGLTVNLVRKYLPKSKETAKRPHESVTKKHEIHRNWVNINFIRVHSLTSNSYPGQRQQWFGTRKSVSHRFTKRTT